MVQIIVGIEMSQEWPILEMCCPVLTTLIYHNISSINDAYLMHSSKCWSVLKYIILVFL